MFSDMNYFFGNMHLLCIMLYNNLCWYGGSRLKAVKATSTSVDSLVLKYKKSSQSRLVKTSSSYQTFCNFSMVA